MAVGFRSGSAGDASRTDWDGNRPRPLSWQAWYPATSGPEEVLQGGGSGAPWFDVGTAARDAPVRAGPGGMPVVLVSHGTGGTAASLGWMGARLARHGFAVLGADHHGNTAAEAYRPEGFLCWWERATDLTALLNHLDRQGPFAGRLDLGRVYAVGFSLGCHTVLSLLGGVTDMERFRLWADRAGGPGARGPREFPDLADRFADLMATRPPFRASWNRRSASYRDARVKAALLLAPAPPVLAFTDESLAAIEAPVHIMVGGGDVEAPAQHGAEPLARALARADIERLGPAVGHFVFMPEATAAGRSAAPDLCIDAPGVDRSAIHGRACDAAIRLFGAAG